MKKFFMPMASLLFGTILLSCRGEEVTPVATPERKFPEVLEPKVLEPTHRVDIYTQLDAKVDILWVLDNSGTMADEREKLGGNFATFINFMVRTRVDYHIGVTSTDMERDGGRLLGSVKFITPETPGAESAFASAVAIQPTELAREQGLGAAMTALTEPNTSGPNVGFLRPEAALVIIVVSDENDGSFGSIAQYTRLIDGLKGAGNEGIVSLSAIVGDVPDGCVRPEEANILWAGATPGTRYIEVANRTGGVVASICTEDFNPMLGELGIAVSGLKRVFPLSRKPQPETIRVKVDGTLIPEDPDTGWTYEADTNSVFFKGGYVPESGSRVEISYEIAPLP